MIRTRQPLPANISRCPATRQVPCMQADNCARGVEPQAIGRQVQDFSIQPRLLAGGCAWFLPIQYAGQKTAEPKVHEAPRGLG